MTDTGVLSIAVAPAAPTVTIDTDVNNDAVLGVTEIGGATTATVTVGLTGTPSVGDIITVSDGTNEQQHTLTQADIDAGSWTTTVALPAAGETLEVSATLTDGSGLASTPATDSAVIDLLDAVDDVATLDTGNVTATVGPEVTTTDPGSRYCRVLHRF